MTIIPTPIANDLEKAEHPETLRRIAFIRAPQCWQKEKPAGVGSLQTGQPMRAAVPGAAPPTATGGTTAAGATAALAARASEGRLGGSRCTCTTPAPSDRESSGLPQSCQKSASSRLELP